MKKLIVLLLLPVFASADPGPATRYLMNEPARLFDMGMHRLNRDLGLYVDNPDGWKNYGIVVKYVVDSDEIVIEFIGRDSVYPAERACDRQLIKMRLISATLLSYFRHFNDSTSTEPHDLKEQLVNRVRIGCIVRETEIPHAMYEARSSLASDKVHKRWPR